MDLKSTLITLIIGSTGGFMASRMGFPAPFLTGPATIVTISCLIGLKCSIDTVFRNFSFIIIGISIGSSATPQLTQALASWPYTMMGMIVNVFVIIIIGKYLFQRVYKLNSNTAVLASCPGLLSFVLGLSEDTKSETVRISVIQSVRVLTLILAVPTCITFLTDFQAQPLSENLEQIGWLHLLWLFVASVLLGRILLEIRCPAAFLFAGMVVSISGHTLDLTPGNVPSFLETFAFIILGSLVGSRFTGVRVSLFKTAFIQGATFTAIALIVALTSAYIISVLSDFPFIDLLIAFAPGGLESMAAIGSLVKADTTFVAFHHLARLLFLTALIPLLLTQKDN